MCTAISINEKCHFFGRTLDVEASYGEKIIIVPRGFKLDFIYEKSVVAPCAIMGIGCRAGDYPLYFDAVNEYGLAGSALNFPNNAVYHSRKEGFGNIASFELIPWVLAECKSVSEAKRLLMKANITGDFVSPEVPASPLHWIFADKWECITVESVKTGLSVFDNPARVLTNNPPFEAQMSHLSSYLHLTAQEPENNLFPNIDIPRVSAGLGAVGLPGDFSSPSRFVRAVFLKNHTEPMDNGSELNRFFQITDGIKIPYGCVKNEKNQNRYTVYTCCINTEKFEYYVRYPDSQNLLVFKPSDSDVLSDALVEREFSKA